MARRFDPNKCSDDELSSIIEKVNKMSTNKKESPFCKHWDRSCGKSGYPQMKLDKTFHDRFSAQPYNPGHLLYCIENRQILNLDGHEMSHICHNKLCIKPAHFSYEPRAINKARDVCRSTNTCTTHRSYELSTSYVDCLLH